MVKGSADSGCNPFKGLRLVGLGNEKAYLGESLEASVGKLRASGDFQSAEQMALLSEHD